MRTTDAHVPDTSGDPRPRLRPAMGEINLRERLPDSLRGLDPDGCGCIFLGIGIGGGFVILCAYVGQAVLAWATHH